MFVGRTSHPSQDLYFHQYIFCFRKKKLEIKTSWKINIYLKLALFRKLEFLENEKFRSTGRRLKGLSSGRRKLSEQTPLCEVIVYL